MKKMLHAHYATHSAFFEQRMNSPWRTRKGQAKQSSAMKNIYKCTG